MATPVSTMAEIFGPSGGHYRGVPLQYNVHDVVLKEHAYIITMIVYIVIPAECLYLTRLGTVSHNVAMCPPPIGQPHPLHVYTPFSVDF